MTAEAADNFVLPFEVAFTIGRVKRVPNLGVRKGVWLDKERTLELLALPDTSTLLGARDYAMLCVFVGCGLRREEVRKLTFEHIKMLDGRWCIADMVGKCNRVRTVAMPDWAKSAIDDYARAAGINQTGLVFRRVRPWKKFSDDLPMTTEAIWNIVRKAGLQLGRRLSPHDLRRTHAKLAYKGGAPLEQIQQGLGHSGLQITQIYLGLEQTLQDAPADYLGVDPRQHSEAKPVQAPPATTDDVSAAARAMQKRATKRFMENTTPEQRSANAAKASAALWEKLSPEERSEHAKQREASIPPEVRSHAASKAAKAKWQPLTREQRRNALEKASKARWKKSRETPGDSE
jgi:hypothetical protein